MEGSCLHVRLGGSAYNYVGSTGKVALESWWCRACLEEQKLWAVKGSAQPPQPELTLEDLVREIAREEIG